jgi:hypothetical protein
MNVSLGPSMHPELTFIPILTALRCPPDEYQWRVWCE